MALLVVRVVVCARIYICGVFSISFLSQTRVCKCAWIFAKIHVRIADSCTHVPKKNTFS